jgi:hypothetical protein
MFRGLAGLPARRAFSSRRKRARRESGKIGLTSAGWRNVIATAEHRTPAAVLD